MPRKHFKKYLPDHHSVRNHRHLRHFGPLLKHHNLWHLNRNSVAGGVAAGMFAGLIPGPVQMLAGAILATIFRVNLPVAMVTTWYTNPITWGPLIVMAYATGSLVTGEPMGKVTEFEFDWSSGDWHQFLPRFYEWFIGLGETYLIGSLILGAILAVLGYAAVQIAWRLYLLAYLKRRRQRRKQTTEV